MSTAIGEQSDRLLRSGFPRTQRLRGCAFGDVSQFSHLPLAGADVGRRFGDYCRWTPMSSPDDPVHKGRSRSRRDACNETAGNHRASFPSLVDECLALANPTPTGRPRLCLSTACLQKIDAFSSWLGTALGSSPWIIGRKRPRCRCCFDNVYRISRAIREIAQESLRLFTSGCMLIADSRLSTALQARTCDFLANLAIPSYSVPGG